MKISILIPVNNYDIIALVHSLKNGIENVESFVEILIGDDGSTEEFRKQYQLLEDEKVRVISSGKNIGRAAIRNRMINEARGDYLLLIDADVVMKGTAENYLNKWLDNIHLGNVICGGILYTDNPPGDPDKLLRWKYGRVKEQIKARERNKHPYSSFSTFNVLIAKSVFSKIRFYEELKQYGHEDTLFGYQLKKAGINVFHIDNGLLHEGLETNKEYLAKVKLSIENLSRLYDNVTDKKTFTDIVCLLKSFSLIKLFRLRGLFVWLFIRYREKMEIRLDTTKSSLFLFWMYRISMFCTFREIHQRRKFLPIFKIPPEII